MRSDLGARVRRGRAGVVALGLGGLARQVDGLKVVKEGKGEGEEAEGSLEKGRGGKQRRQKRRRGTQRVETK